MCIITQTSLFSVISNRYVLCIRLSCMHFVCILVYIGEILVNLQISLVYFWISPLYIVKSMKSLIFVIFVLVSSLESLCTSQCSAGFRRGRGRDHYFVYLFSEAISHLLIFIHFKLYI